MRFGPNGGGSGAIERPLVFPAGRGYLMTLRHAPEGCTTSVLIVGIRGGQTPRLSCPHTSPEPLQRAKQSERARLAGSVLLWRTTGCTIVLAGIPRTGGKPLLGAQDGESSGPARPARWGTACRGVVSLIIAVIALLLWASAASASPTLTSFNLDEPAASGTPFEVAVYGSGFGTQPPPGTPVSSLYPGGYTGSDYGTQLYVCDNTQGWCAGENTSTNVDLIGLTLVGLTNGSNWSDGLAAVDSGSAFVNPSFNYRLLPGDSFSVNVEGASCTGTLDASTNPTVSCGGSGPPPSAPTVVTGSATNVQSSAATLNGTVNPNGTAVTNCHFEYGTSTFYGSTVPCAQSVGGGTSPVNVSATATGLTPGTTYHFELVANLAWFGTDQMLTTPGTSTPTVITGGPFPEWPDSANLSGTINPHRHSVTYWFEYGLFSGPPSLSSYPLSTPAVSLSGTSDVNVFADINNLNGDTKYYYRLFVRSDDGSLIPGGEGTFEVTPPEPQPTRAPYMQVNGSDANSGYAAKCVPGTWQNTNGSFRIRWVYVHGGGTTSSAPGKVGKLSYPGDEYMVSAQDIGQFLACQVTPYALDGRLATADEQVSDLLPVEGPGHVVLPAWFKKELEVADQLELSWSVYKALGGAEICAAALAVPGFGEGLCFLYAVELLQSLDLSGSVQVLNEVSDPPDRNYAALALPGKASGVMSQICHGGAGRCAHASPAVRALATAPARVVSLIDALLVSRNRTLIARRRHDTTAELLQEAARKVYAGQLAAAFLDEHRAAAALARALQRAHTNPRIPAAAIRKASLADLVRILGRPLMRRLNGEGITPATLRKAPRSGKATRAVDVLQLLRAPEPHTPFQAFYNTISINDLMALVTGFARQRAMPTSAVPRSFADLDATRAACTPALRTVALQRFLKDAKRALRPQFYSFLSTAAQPLSDGNSPTDPYPQCLG